jgi:hypothetical protein
VGRVFCDSGALRRRQNSASSNYHGLQGRLEYRNLFSQLTGGVGFSWSKTIDNVSEVFPFSNSGSVAFSQNPFDIVAAERGLSNIHLGRTLTAYWIWDVPLRKQQVGAAGKLLGGWEVAGSLFLYDGRPWTPIQFILNRLLDPTSVCGEDFVFNTQSVGAFETCRPYLGNPSAPPDTVGLVGDPNARWWINDGSLGPFGVGRNPNDFGDGTVLVNMGFFKNTKFGPDNRFNVQFRTAIVNLLNHRNFGVPASLFIEDSDATVIGGPGLFGRPRRNDTPGRVIRFSLALLF